MQNAQIRIEYIDERKSALVGRLVGLFSWKILVHKNISTLLFIRDMTLSTTHNQKSILFSQAKFYIFSVNLKSNIFPGYSDVVSCTFL